MARDRRIELLLHNRQLRVITFTLIPQWLTKIDSNYQILVPKTSEFTNFSIRQYGVAHRIRTYKSLLTNGFQDRSLTTRTCYMAFAERLELSHRNFFRPNSLANCPLNLFEYANIGIQTRIRT